MSVDVERETSEPLIREPSLYDVAGRHNPWCKWFAARVFPRNFCMSKKKLAELVDQHRKLSDDGLDKWNGLSYSLAAQFHINENEDKIEIEDTESAEEQEIAFKRLKDIYDKIIPTGVAIWSLMIGSGLIAGFLTDCKHGTPFFFYLILFGVMIFQVYQIETLTKLVSGTIFEGRHFVTMIGSLQGLDDYRMLVGFALLDLMGKFSRALFAGQSYHCDDDYNLAFAKSWESSHLWMFAPFVRWMGLGGFSILSFIAGPIIFQGSLMLHARSFLLKRLSQCKQRAPKQSMGMHECMDEYGALADWASLNPVAKIFDIAALPALLEDENDAWRLWDRMRTRCLLVATNVIPDNICQAALQVRFLALAYDELSFMAKDSGVAAL